MEKNITLLGILHGYGKDPFLHLLTKTGKGKLGEIFRS